MQTIDVNQWWVTTFGQNADMARMVSSIEIMVLILFLYATLKTGKVVASEVRSVYVFEALMVVLAILGAIVLFALLK
jgi:hypothetical protein